MVLIAYPLVWLSEKISRLFKSDPDTISRDEIVAMADIGLSHGAIEQAEHKALKGLIQFEEVKAKDIITPKEKVRSLLSHLSLENAYQDILDHTYSRIVVFNQKGGVEGYVLRSQLLHAHIINSNEDVQSITSALITLKESISLPSLFQKLLRRREHICSIENDAGEFLGIITLEDLIENMLDIEIYDEQDHLNPT
jgi:CBS domain containing-hemolysin-like protein